MAKDEPMSPEEWERVGECLEKASNVNRDSPHRRELRQILNRHDLELAEWAVLAHAEAEGQ